MKNRYLAVKVGPELKERIAELAKNERRSIADQTAYLVEMGLRSLEKSPGPEYTDRRPAPMGGAYGRGGPCLDSLIPPSP
jgi:hypothetical protein